MNALRRIARGESTFDIASHLKRWMIVSGIVLAFAVVGLAVRKLNFSIEFKGGSSYEVTLAPGASRVTVPAVQDAIEEFDLGEAKVQVTGDGRPGDRIIVRAQKSTQQVGDVQQALATVAGQGSGDFVSVQDVGPTWGRQVSTKAFRALIVFLILVFLYITLRFEFKMAVGAIIAVAHDLIATAGLYALVGFQVSPATVIALLTMLGFSLYDTVVVFDKVRETVEAQGTGRASYTDIVNRAVNLTLMRSINTSLTVLVPIGALLFVGVYAFGAVTLQDLALAMFLGSAVSAYSSIFVAVPILTALKEREPRYRNLRARASAEPAREAAHAATAPPSQEGATEPPSPAREPLAVPRPSGPRPGPRPRKKRRGKRR